MSDRSDAFAPAYALDRQVGFLLRRANQRHLAIFSRAIPDLTPTQFAAVAKLSELGSASQNALGRATAMDAATIKGVIDRLRARGLVASTPDPNDQRRVQLALTAAGQKIFADLTETASRISAETLAPLSEDERSRFLDLLGKLT